MTAKREEVEVRGENSCDNLQEESQKIKRSRAKLLRKIKRINEAVTAGSMAAKAKEIQKRLFTNSQHRVPVKRESLGIFDGNKSTAEVSARVRKLLLTLSNSQQR